MKKMNVMGAVLLLLIGIDMPAAAQQQHNYREDRGPHLMLERIVPDLDEAQHIEIDKLRTQHFKSMIAMRAEIEVLTAELRALEISEKADQKSINSKIDEVMVLKTKLMKEGSKHRQDVRKLLTEEQRAMFDVHASRKLRQGRQGRYSGREKGPYSGS